MKPPSEMRVDAYMRVSMLDMHCENQEPCIKDRCAREGFSPNMITWHVEQMSSKKERPVKTNVMRRAAEGLSDIVIFARMDRWGRSTVELIEDADKLVSMNVRVIIVKDNFDLSRDAGGFNSTSRLLFTIIAAFAESERMRISERTLEGLARAKAWGKIGGRHPVGCGCGIHSEKLGWHNGPVKPIRDEKNRITGWKFVPPDSKAAVKAPQSTSQ